MASRRHRPPKGRHLESRTRVRVRFSEVDTLQIVWHGHYLEYFEDARVELGRRHGINYTDIRAAGLTAPVVHVACDFYARWRASIPPRARRCKACLGNRSVPSHPYRAGPRNHEG